MINIYLNNNAQAIFATPLEKLNSAPLFYYFKFKSRQTGNIVEFTAVDISNSPRYQKFIIDPSVLFAGQREGFWNYEIKAAINNNNTDPGGVVCESGLAYIRTAADYINGIYNEQNNEVKTYSK